jgi:pyruvate/2-oxoglutarate/acetoin dehydrogenase E1 component/pyruvate/2-oxoglutarate dehydrogenase complex dihydrolipoamide acyltransferase (E2) component
VTTPPRVVENLNRALHRLFAERPDLHLLGEDVLDPYGGAFKVTSGLSSRYPERVLTTPLSEAGFVGVAAGLALAGDQVVVEAMFGDFATLMFDQMLNFVSKSVSMYGHHVPMRLVLRCPVGGQRGYGPTHSQSVQKHFIGIPNLTLYETSPFHDAYHLLGHALDHGPAILFEDKVLYTRRIFRDGLVDEGYRFTLVGPGPGWAYVTPTDDAPADVVLICPGGVAHRALDAARRLRQRGVNLRLLVPGQLYPLDIAPVRDLVADAVLVAVAEESTPGGGWGNEVAALVHDQLWSRLRAPVLRLCSADSIIPTARHLEERVLLGERHITDAVVEALTGLAAVPTPRPTSTVITPRPTSATGTPAGPAVPDPQPPAVDRQVGEVLTVPKLNNNDTSYLVLDWLADDGAWVEADTPLVELETSKAVEEIVAPIAGHLVIRAAKGDEVEVGAVLAELLASAPAASAPVGTPIPGTVPSPAVCAPDGQTGVHRLDRVQRGVAALVTRAHREVPAAFTAVEVRTDPLAERLRRLSESTGAEVGLAEAVVKAVAAAHPDHGHLYGTLVDEQTVALAEAPHVAVTLDLGNGLYTPVLRDCAVRSVTDLADDLMDFRLKAWRGEFTASELAGGTITVSLNTDEGVTFVQPIVMWPQLCAVSVGGPRRRMLPGPTGPEAAELVTLGIAYDHRVVNGRDAVAFLHTVAKHLTDPERVDRLLAVHP